MKCDIEYNGYDWHFCLPESLSKLEEIHAERQKVRDHFAAIIEQSGIRTIGWIPLWKERF